MIHEQRRVASRRPVGQRIISGPFMSDIVEVLSALYVNLHVRTRSQKRKSLRRTKRLRPEVVIRDNLACQIICVMTVAEKCVYNAQSIFRVHLCKAKHKKRALRLDVLVAQYMVPQ